MTKKKLFDFIPKTREDDIGDDKQCTFRVGKRLNHIRQISMQSAPQCKRNKEFYFFINIILPQYLSSLASAGPH